MQGEPVGYIGDLKYTPFEVKKISRGKILDTDIPLYTAPPSTEALQKDKAEMIEYARHLRYQLELIDNYRLDLQFTVGSNFERAYTTARYGLSILQPKCME